MDGDLPRAVAGQAVTLTLTDEIDISRGDVLAAPEDLPYYADRLEAKIVWLHEDPLQPGRGYLLKAGSSTAPAQVAELKFKVNVNTLQQEAGSSLQLNEVGVCSLTLGKAITFDSYRENRGTGNFILIDRLTNATVGAGMIHQPMLHPGGIPWQSIDVDRQARASLKGQHPRLLWLSGGGSPSLAALLEKKLHSLGRHTYVLDGDAVHRRLGLPPVEPAEQVRRTSEIAKLFVEAGLIVITSGNLFQQVAPDGFAPEDYQEIYIQPPIGADPDQAPGTAAMILNGTGQAADELAEYIVKQLF
jgi:bifunctional enzyme CysN/CysC